MINNTPYKMKAEIKLINNDIDKIEAILDRTVRPTLSEQGIYIRAVDYSNKSLEILPTGKIEDWKDWTVLDIENLLQKELDSEIVVSLTRNFF